MSDLRGDVDRRVSDFQNAMQMSAAIKALRAEIKASEARLGAKIDKVETKLEGRIERF